MIQILMGRLSLPQIMIQVLKAWTVASHIVEHDGFQTTRRYRKVPPSILEAR
jgi:hypothetical protein